MGDEQWHEASKTPPAQEGHIVTGNRRPDGTWRIMGIHPPGSGRAGLPAGTFWAHLPDWIIQGPTSSF